MNFFKPIFILAALLLGIPAALAQFGACLPGFCQSGGPCAGSHATGTNTKAIDGSASAQFTSTNTGTITLTTASSNDVVILAFYSENSTGVTQPVVTGVTSGSLTWAKRKAYTWTSDSGFPQNLEFWWATASAPLAAEVITITLNTAVDGAAYTAFGVSGSPSPSSPWDTNAGLAAANASRSIDSPDQLTVSCVATDSGAPMVIGAQGTFENAVIQIPVSPVVGIAFRVNGAGLWWAITESFYRNYNASVSNGVYSITPVTPVSVQMGMIIDALQ